ncbi:hypothetical protein F5Y15DRAFT_418402 [Xylariaceae sp. FL0016]|nr:hypothetical protein F5Y15DRAFT_418402 [Xylariaceae sp. FL0016]
MHMSGKLLALSTLLYAAAPVLGFDSVPFLGPLQPWEVSSLQVQSIPSSGDDADSIAVSLLISNPNNITAGPAPHADGGGYLPFEQSTANCTAKWQSSGDWKASHCSEVSFPESYGVWTFEVVSLQEVAETAVQSVDIKFSLDYNVTRWGSVYYKLLEGTGHFDLGSSDGGDPVLVDPTIVQCQGTC